MLIKSILKFLVLTRNNILFALKNEIFIQSPAPLSSRRVCSVLEPWRRFQQATLYKLNA